MAGISDAAELLVLDSLNRVGAAYQPAGLFLTVFTVNPNFETGAGGTEAVGGGFVRKALTMGGAAGPSPATAANTGAVAWTCGTDIAADTYTGFAVYSASPGGTFLWGAAFGAGRTLALAGDILNFAIGAIINTLD
jgi:hypothetical protein